MDTGTLTAETTAPVPVVVDFWAVWCGPCRMISPVLEDLAKRHAGDLKVVKVDVDSNPGLATRFGAQSIPLLVVIRDGKDVAHHTNLSSERRSRTDDRRLSGDSSTAVLACDVSSRSVRRETARRCAGEQGVEGRG
jgi:thioredoxin